MEQRFNDKVAIITGSTRGIGEGIARRLSAEGAAVVISGRDKEAGLAIVADLEQSGARAIWQPADIGSVDDCKALIERTIDHFGRLDILVNNAAHLGYFDADTITPEEWDAVFAVNVRGPFLLSRDAAPHMKAQGGGSIVNIGTCMTMGGSMERLSYSTSKTALLSLNKSLGRAWARDNVRVNWVTVGWVASPREILHRDETHGDGRKFLAEKAEQMPTGRLSTEEDIAGGVAFLCSDEAAHVIGSEFNISGGLR